MLGLDAELDEDQVHGIGPFLRMNLNRMLASGLVNGKDRRRCGDCSGRVNGAIDMPTAPVCSGGERGWPREV
jgi:hypothetical protein